MQCPNASEHFKSVSKKSVKRHLFSIIKSTDDFDNVELFPDNF